MPADYATVPMESLCVLIETAQRLGIYQGTDATDAFDAWMAMPEEVFARLAERANERTERLLAGAKASNLHREGREHDESICVDCVTAKADDRQ